MGIYLHTYIGKLPECFFDSVTSIFNIDKSAKVILITDQNIDIKNVTVCKIDDIASEQTKNVMRMNLFSDQPNPLWKTSLFRFFLIRDALKGMKLSYCYHFDSDVLLFEPPEIFEKGIDVFDGLSITFHKEDEIVFGFSKFGTNHDKIDSICDILYEIVFDDKKRKEYYNRMPNEMELIGNIALKRPDLINHIPILPTEGEIIFDPSSYGQFFGGTPHGDPPGFAHESHIIGREILAKRITPIMIDKKPYVEYNGKRFPIVNLHIHSKKTYNFL